MGNRTLLLRGYDTLSQRGRAKLQIVFDLDDPTDELSAARGVKEQLRRLLKSTSVDHARREKMIFTRYVLAADMAETWRLWATIDAWWLAVEVLIATGVTNARTETANTAMGTKRTGRGCRNSRHYPSPYLAAQRPTRGRNTLNNQGATVDRGGRHFRPGRWTSQAP